MLWSTVWMQCLILVGTQFFFNYELMLSQSVLEDHQETISVAKAKILLILASLKLGLSSIQRRGGQETQSSSGVGSVLGIKQGRI